MNNETVKFFLGILRSSLCGEPLSEEEKKGYSPDILPHLIRLAKYHDVSHLLAFGLQENRLLDSENCQAMEKAIFLAVYRYEQSRSELNQLCNAFEKAKIPFVPLKGAVIRRYYPEPWMRTSCDIDVLVREEDLEKAVECLVNDLDYQYNHKFTHDVSLSAKSGLHVELHYNLMEDEPVKSSRAVLNRVWETAVRLDGYEYWHELPDEVFYFYHIAHMAKHFENGGCGVRPFIDLNILHHKVSFDEKKRAELLRKGDLTLFEAQAKLLSEVWFGGAEHTHVTCRMENFILRGGVYGSAENHIAVQQQKKGGKIKYAFSKIWLPYDLIKYYYPVLGKYKCFTPIMEVRRWLRLLFGGQFKKATRELNYNANMTKDQIKETETLLRNIGL